MSEHTPGPLFVIRNTEYRGTGLRITTNPNSQSENFRPVAIVSKEADAILYAAAPELLEALEGCLELLCDMPQDLSDLDDSQQRHDARAAIAKATGEGEG